MAITPHCTNAITFEIKANPPLTPLALSIRSPKSSEATTALPALTKLQHLKMVDKVHTFIKHLLEINQLGKQLDYSKHPSTPFYHHDITSTTNCDTKALAERF
jgi:hypothetical protein